jgi:serine/threonine protein kinase
MLGKTITHYEILEEIGRGGMGEVYLARDLDLERHVAIKFLPKDLTRDIENVDRFKREARAAATLNHPNIITIYEIGVSEGEYFIVMEYVKGMTLRDKLRQEPKLIFTDIIAIIEQLCQGLEKAHEAGIIHRDIKPENIFINEEGRVKILDFGLAKLRGSKNLTKDLSTLGTIKYISPEQARGEETNAQSDIWSTGIILYEMLSGDVPFKGDYEQAIIYGILNENPQPLDELRADIPTEMTSIVDKSLRKNPENRYQLISQLTSDLDLIQTIKKSPSEPSGLSKLFPLKYIYWSVAILVALVVAMILSMSETGDNLDQIILQITPLMEKGDYDAVYDHVVNSGNEIDDIVNSELFDPFVGYISIDSRPQNTIISLSRVRYKPKLHLDSESSPGETPLVNHRLIAGEYHLRLNFSDANSRSFIIEVDPTDSLTIFRSLGHADFSEEGMVLIEPGKSFEGESMPPFYMDIYEVSNKEYFSFVSAGGYRLTHLWPDEMVLKKSVVPQSAALKSFIDQTGIPAPRQWSGGKYPVGKEDHPVTGVTWYEANAYALWAGKQLPEWKQWWRASVAVDNRIYPWGNDVTTISARANFGSAAVRQVGSYPFGISPYGCFDMAGNVSEWLKDLNGIENPARVVGGSWQNPSYMFEPTHASPFQRDYSSTDIGFRCIKPVKKE